MEKVQVGEIVVEKKINKDMYNLKEINIPYLIKFKYSNNLFHTIWGESIINEDYDLFLLNDEKCIVFLVKESLFNFGFNTFEYFQDEIDMDIIISLVKKKSEELFIQKYSSDITDLLNFVGDYAKQTENATILDLYKGNVIQKFLDFHYDSHFWKPANKSELPDIGIDNNMLFENLYKILDLMKQKIVVV